MFESVNIIRSKRKSLSLEVTDTARIIVRAPFRLSQKKITHFVLQHEQWLKKKHAEAKKRSEAIPVRTYRPDDALPYLGASYPISHELHKTMKLTDQFYFSAKDPSDRKSEANRWYRKQARRVYLAYMKQRAPEMGVAFNTLRITSAQKRWGSCSTKGNISITWRLIMAPPHVIDYVIVHELAHLTHMNHSRRFWAKVKKHLPEHKEAKKWLVDHGHILVV